MRYFIGQISQSDLKVSNATVDQSSTGTILQIVFGIAAGVALIILTLAGLKYVTSRGDPTAVAKAKNTILYAVIGLAISAAAFTIVGFVVKNV